MPKTTPAQPPLLLSDNSDFNEHIDDQHEEINIFEATYRASEVLFNVDLEAYKSYLAEYSASQEDEENSEANATEKEEAQSEDKTG